MQNLVERIQIVSNDCHLLCKKFLGYYLPVAGNIGVFCQSDQEYIQFKSLSEKLTKNSDNPNRKYFEILEPIVVESENDIPTVTYTHLYIRKPDPTSYGKYLGDVDFVMEINKYQLFKKEVIDNKHPDGVGVYERPGWDTIELHSPEIKSVGYVSTQEFAEKVRVKFD